MLTHMFWVGGPLTQLEIICINSFLDHGYNVQFWSYRPISNLPIGAVYRSAGELLPEDELFLNSQGSYAGASDIFRYLVLREYGGLYTDTDVVALVRPEQLPKNSFLVTEKLRNSNNCIINGNVLYVDTPSKGNLIDLAFSYAEKFPKEHLWWSEIGPMLLTAIVSIYPRHGFLIMEPEFANPFSYSDCPAKLLDGRVRFDCKSAFIHLYNGMWDRCGVDKNAPYPQGSIMHRISDSTLATSYDRSSDVSSDRELIVASPSLRFTKQTRWKKALRPYVRPVKSQIINFIQAFKGAS